MRSYAGPSFGCMWYHYFSTFTICQRSGAGSQLHPQIQWFNQHDLRTNRTGVPIAAINCMYNLLASLIFILVEESGEHNCFSVQI
jgi:hypothetical protein